MIKNSFQILLSENSEELPPVLEKATESFKQCFSYCSYKFYNKDMIEEFLKFEFEEDVLKAFNKLKPKAFKKDLASYCIAYKYGGWYADITIKFIKNININNTGIEFLGFMDVGNGVRPNTLPYPVQTSLFYANKGSKIMNRAIKLIVEHCKKEYYGLTSTSPTGPGVLGRAIAYNGLESNQIVGHFMPLTPNHRNQNRSYILPDGSIVALHKDAWFPKAQPADLSAFGISDSDNYLEMCKKKDIYNKEIN